MDNHTEANQATRSLRQLLEDWQTNVAGSAALQPPEYDGPDVALANIVEHTDDVIDGSLFVARVRAGSDGHPYIPQAVAKGARVILAQRPLSEMGIEVPEAIQVLHVADTAEATAWLSAAWYGFPGQKLTVIGVTGTDGKTTTCTLLYHILRAAGIAAGMITTIGAFFGDSEEPTGLHVTTPEAPAVQATLRRMVNAGLTHVVLEATSHGLEQHRVTAVDFDIGVVTNITHEHLDYHGGYEGYRKAKARLFEMLVAGGRARDRGYSYGGLRQGKTAVLNLDDDSFAALVQIPVPRQFVYTIQQAGALQGRPGVHATEIEYGADKTRFLLHLPSDEIAITSALVGEFNVYNMLAAAAAASALAEEVGPEEIKAGLEAVQAIRGRMQRVNRGQPFPVIVDFAHTPNALAKAISAGRAMIGDEGRVITVFGSAGKRDVIKRRLMAEISAHQADLTVLTAEDPRTESLDDILAMMAEAARASGAAEGKQFWRVPDRGQAIYMALRLAGPEDLVLICGKGHEESMCFGTVEYPWDDVATTERALDAFLCGQPMPDMGLPTYHREA